MLDDGSIRTSPMPIFERSQFRKSTRSGQDPQRCVEVARAEGWVAIRDSKQSWNSVSDHRLVCTAEQFDAWVAETADTPCLEIVRRGNGTNEFRSTVAPGPDNVLEFTDAEIEAFLAGARDGEFAGS